MSTSGIRYLDRTRVPEGTNRVYLRASLLTLAGNAVLVVAKGMVARASGSQAIYADAINSLTDVGFSVLMVLVLRLALQPADDGHPHGHSRFEPLVSLTIGVMMALAGAEAVRSAVRVLIAGPEEITGVWPLIIPGATMALKSAMYWQVARLANQVSSPALRASARDNLSDILTAAVVLLGVGANALGAHLADPIAALGVSAWIFRNAYLVLSESIHHLAGGAASPELYDRVRQAILATSGVLGIDQLIIEHVGPQVRVDIHIIMDGQTSLQQVHWTSHAVRAAVEALPNVEHAFIHVEPQERLP